MASPRPFDIIVFGATGFTGERIALYLYTLSLRNSSSLPSSSGPFLKSWAIAGRNESKLLAIKNKIKLQAEAKTNIKNDAIDIPIIIADVENPDSLAAMSAQATVVISAAGPYRFYGEPVVAACIKTKSHYVDVTGEPEYIERIMLNYYDKAKEAGVSVVSSTGFDSIPADLGNHLTTQLFYKQFKNSKLHEIDSFLSLNVGPNGHVGNTGTWFSLVHGLSSTNTLGKIRKALKQKFSDTFTVPRQGKPSPKPAIFTAKAMPGKPWAMKFPGADASVVRNSQMLLAYNGLVNAESPSQPWYNAFFTLRSTKYLIFTLFFGVWLTIFTRFKWTRNLLINYPSFFSFGLFSSKGPSDKQIDECTFSMDFFAKGISEKALNEFNNNNNDGKSKLRDDLVLHTRLEGPEPGYVATCWFAAQSAIQLLKNKDITRGVLTPAVAFGNSSLMTDLIEEGIKFQTLE